MIFLLFFDYRERIGAMMLDFSYCSNTYFEFGKDKEEMLGILVKKFGGKRVLVVYGGGSVLKSGLMDRVKAILENNSIYYSVLGGVKANPESDFVYEGINLCKKDDIDFIVAVGGGSVIDSAKAIGAGALYDGDFWDFFKNKDRKVVEASLPVGVILTIAAAGSEGSNSMVITHSKTHDKRGNIRCDVVRPVFAIMNPTLTMSLTSYQSACGIVDIMTHIIERYFSNTANCYITDSMCEGVLKAIIQFGKVVIDEPDNYNARANIMWASMIAHNNILGVDREQDWASHKIEHELSGKYDVAHGAGLAVIVPRWMRYVSKINPTKFLEFSKNVFGVNGIDEGINRLENFWNGLGLSSSLEKIGFREEDLSYLVENVDYKDGYIGNYVKLNKDDVRKIYEI